MIDFNTLFIYCQNLKILERSNKNDIIIKMQEIQSKIYQIFQNRLVKIIILQFNQLNSYLQFIQHISCKSTTQLFIYFLEFCAYKLKFPQLKYYIKNQFVPPLSEKKRKRKRVFNRKSLKSNQLVNQLISQSIIKLKKQRNK
ncbi:hypothetical protein TTHERM_000180958 (macronuclear) [Tetrahymena thermophila SB210]|uniref:Uncharacterized protein n=1 Tax=Tetrahymena thermophila (strain SB210) TaxID=312017 RepID=W7XK48_TETTS|nr:hypothetical protein TTHERM_000180958 [Tetrahymena thermophila SB210]EWS76211.1 hypothetical protein TTHERM_000180958 [Tetrahymena thermophila SB210]|eukprot:XP_012651258.1 hypothetical protein TTHERM_000180958 [Tetrahymena thermophila SB210]